MREFLLNSEELLDREVLNFLNQEGLKNGLFPCSWIYFNERVKLAYFTEGYQPLSQILPDLNLDQAAGVASAILRRTEFMQATGEVYLENVIWDPDSIYVNDKREVFLICLPSMMPPGSFGSDIYIKRIYALVEDLVSVKEGGDFLCRQIDYQKGKAFGDWSNLRATLSLRAPVEGEDDRLTLRSINTPRPCTFRINQENFNIGTDPGEADGLILEVDTVDPLHAVIGWNGINYYVMDLGSENGTFVNDQRIAPEIEIPIGEGTVLRFADYTFNVE